MTDVLKTCTFMHISIHLTYPNNTSYTFFRFRKDRDRFCRYYGGNKWLPVFKYISCFVFEVFIPVGFFKWDIVLLSFI